MDKDDFDILDWAFNNMYMSKIIINQSNLFFGGVLWIPSRASHGKVLWNVDASIEECKSIRPKEVVQTPPRYQQDSNFKFIQPVLVTMIRICTMHMHALRLEKWKP